jgi:hypothetical protein
MPQKGAMRTSIAAVRQSGGFDRNLVAAQHRHRRVAGREERA